MVTLKILVGLSEAYGGSGILPFVETSIATWRLSIVELLLTMCSPMKAKTLMVCLRDFI